ncbi:heterokaryon incompatibility protein-domain-containing protein [Podospora aff. communis PSN243]|uniref:Heterokaryon incompatibility protein-domain-containing protein n=1 Tax=Podospora aff. communis PSN243 TaxID=3040156 RepID=A0AAV9G4H5_9PEZI|nr:heterokaryon incompatibility protein-domain-containing protein [Podospora aff. communis PSN243]
MLPFNCECSPWCNADLYPELPSGDAIRILEVMPGAHDSPLICTLHIVTLPRAANSYSALSYAWQIDLMPHPPRAIICNGREVQIGENLFDAMKRVRHVTSSQMIWADALCINQDDIEERSTQVAKMGDIFHSAHEVLVWLGNEDKRRALPCAFSIAAALSDLCTIVNTWRRNRGKESLIQKARFYQRTPEGGVRVAPQCAPDERSKRFGYNRYWWSETLRLFNLRWFHRVWVIQEVALARSARVLLGEYEISWEVIGLAASILRTNFNTLLPTVSQKHTRKTLVGFRTGVLNAYFMYRLSRSQSHTERMQPDFHQLLTLTRSFDCKDPRDRIYGLIGLPFSTSDPEKSPLIIPDYSKSTAEVYLEIATKLIQDSQTLRLLSSIQRPSPRSRPDKHGPFDPNIPSWIPQWTFSETQSLIPFETIPLPPSPIQPTPPNLRVLGTPISIITTTSPPGIRADFCIPWYALPTHDPSILNTGIHNGRTVSFPLDASGEEITDSMLLRNLSQSNLTQLAMILTAGNDWRGQPPEEGWEVRNRWGKYAYQMALTVGQMRLLEEKLGVFARGGNGTRFLDAAGTVGKGRRRLATGSGLRGIGPGAMEVGDAVWVLRGASVPFVLRGKEGGYEVVGECYLYVPELREGEGVQDGLRKVCGGEEEWLELV